MLNLNTALQRFGETQLKYTILDADGGGKIAVLERGGRILPFVKNPQTGSLISAFWTNHAFETTTGFEGMISEGNWNIGGERLWIAPELQYFVRDRNKIAESYFVPKSMDPGKYTLEESSKTATLKASMELDAYNYASGIKLLEIERKVRRAKNPLSYLPYFDVVMKELTYSGYEHTILLKDKGSKLTAPSNAMSETWTLIQLCQGGSLVIPVYNTPEYAWYHKPEDTSVLRLRERFAELSLREGEKYKIGFKAPHVVGRVGYVRSWPGIPDIHILIIRNFYVNPSAFYTEEPFTEPGDRGFPFHVYNDDGSLGLFGELECNGMAIGGNGDEFSYDNMATWIFTGPAKGIERAGRLLLGFS